MALDLSQWKPRVFRSTVQVRFADVDAYGHVNTTHYMDYVISSRFRFTREHFGLDAENFVEKGIGFFLTRFEINFKRPISGGQDILIESLLGETRDRGIQVCFKILSPDTKKLFSEGTFHCAVIDITTKRPCLIPDWLIPVFYEPKE